MCALAQARQSSTPSPVPPAGPVASPTGAAASSPQGRAEPAIAGFVRQGSDAISLSLPGKPPAGSPAELLLHSFSFNGEAVPATKLHLRQLAPGVFEIKSLAYSVGEWQFRVRDAASYFGLGEHFDTLDHSHQILRNASQDNAGPKGSSTYKPMPFLMSTTGYGLWVDTTADAEFDLNLSSRTDIQIAVPAERLRVVLFTGPEFPAILAHFTALAGRPELPPYWAFAPWLGRDYYQNGEQVRDDLEKARSLKLPGSVLLIDSPWATGYNSYRFNPKQFSDAPAMVKDLHRAGYKLVLWHTPWINSQSDPPHEAGFAGKIDLHTETYDEAAANRYFVRTPDGKPYVGRWWKGEGSLIDFTNPAARQWWQGQVRQAIQAGADGFKDDDAEGSFLGQVVFADGTDPQLMRNRYAVLYNQAVEELVQKDLKGNGVLLARSVTQGANGLGFLWGGDSRSSFSPETGLPTVVTAGLNAGLSGMPLWTSDIGGYLNSSPSPDPQLEMRWTEFAAFSPIMEICSESNREPWDWGTAALETYRRYATLHMSLFPYRYAAAQTAAKTGMPLMRALVLLYQDDPEAREARDEYLFGPDLLVAPVTDRNTRRPVYLPKGEWVDYWTGAAVSGGQTLLVDAPFDTVPVYLRAGAVLPKIPDDVMTLVPASESGNKAIQTLDERRVYEMTGTPAGETSMTDFEGREVRRSGSTLHISGKPAHVILRWRFASIHSVSVNGSAARLESAHGVSTVEFDLTKTAEITWQ